MRWSGLCIVGAIAATHVAATQLAAHLESAIDLSPLFMMWLSTVFNTALVLPLWVLTRSSDPACRECDCRAFALVAPFFALWAGANTLYLQALTLMSSSLVMAVFSTTPAFVALLAVPPLLVLAVLWPCSLCLPCPPCSPRPWPGPGWAAPTTRL